MSQNSEQLEKRVFVVEDEFTKKSGLSALLAEVGFDVRSAPHGADVLAEIISAKPTIIITDLEKQSSDDPFVLVEKIIGSPELKGSEVFVYTESIDVALEVQLRRLKLSAYFIKGETSKFLVEGVKNFFVKEDPTDLAPPPPGESENFDSENPGPPNAGEKGGPGFDEFSVKVNKGVGDNDGETLFNLGVSYMEMGLLPEAEHEFSLAANDPKLRLDALVSGGICLRKMGKFKEAADRFKLGMESAPDRDRVLEFRYEIGVTLEEAGMLKEAFSFFGSVYKEDKTFRDVGERLVKIQGELKNLA
ncbi:MAG: hypothetical protein HY280_00750 [Nitrospinae bacterium]|nr:hypothetical protein [Nitrospinota bacterium]